MRNYNIPPGSINEKKLKNKGLHPSNIHNQGYDFPLLIKDYPPLKEVVKKNTYGNLSIDFANPNAVKLLNSALLQYHYQIVDWDIPNGALCPPIPGRVDYILYIADLLSSSAAKYNITTNIETAPSKGESEVKMLDIGTGANGIYPLLACQLFNWQCVGTDINSQSLANVANILSKNPSAAKKIELRLQKNNNKMFSGIIAKDEIFDITVCNPPFHSSMQEAIKSSQRKVTNLARNKQKRNDVSLKEVGKIVPNMSPELNFGGSAAELWCNGGERLFLKKLITESKEFANQCRWFTTLVSKKENIKSAKKLINKLSALDTREIEMIQGNKITRILAWTFTQQ